MPSPLLSATLLLGASLLPSAARTAELAEIAESAALTVTATRTPTEISDVPATVTVITAQQIEDLLMDDIKDLVRFEPGISVRTQPSRPGAAFGSTGRDGNSGFTVRGLSGNRVLIQQDLVRLPDSFEFGAQSVGRGDYLDLDLVKSVEFLRGPTSALYGSDGLAGAVSFTTRDPEDLLQTGQQVSLRGRLAYTGADEGWGKSIMLAAREGRLSTLIAYSRRDAGPTQNRGTNASEGPTRTVPNPLDLSSDSVLAKLVLDAAPGHRLRLTYDHSARRTATDVLSGRGAAPFVRWLVADLDTLDTSVRDRVSLDWRYEGDGLVESGFLIGYHQSSRTRQAAFEVRTGFSDRSRINSFDNRVNGLNGQLALRLKTGDIGHRLLLGADYTDTLQTGLRDGTVAPIGEPFPTKAFPDTDYVQAGGFIADTIDVGSGRLLIYPAVRFDHYRLSPRPSSLFPGQAVGQSGQRVSPKFGAVWWATPVLGLSANYAEGFRSPTPSQVNNGFANPFLGYASLPNADLQPETSRAFEAGIRLRDADVGGVRINAALTGFSARYRNFIDQFQVSGSFTPQDPAIFQFINFGRVSIKGIEFRADAELGHGFAFNLAAAWAEGQSSGVLPGGTRVAELPLSPIDPFNLVAGVSWKGLNDRLVAQAIVTHSAGKRQDDIAEACSPACFASPGFTIVDLTAAFTLTPQAVARLGVFNLTNRKYWWWNDVRGLAGASPIADAFTQPGRNVSASLILRY
jgi:hemoglobin/transferrin/lactoferrin receptor protein